MDNTIREIEKELKSFLNNDINHLNDLEYKLNSFRILNSIEKAQILNKLSNENTLNSIIDLRLQLLNEIIEKIKEKNKTNGFSSNETFADDLVLYYLFKDFNIENYNDSIKNIYNPSNFLSMQMKSKMVPKKIEFKNLISIRKEDWAVYDKKTLSGFLIFWIIVYSAIFYFFY
jgi:hypothetical protein